MRENWSLPMLHDINEPTPSAETALRDEYQRVVNGSGDEKITRSEAAAIAAENVDRLIDQGEVQEPSRHDALVAKVVAIDARQGQAADRIIEKLSRGEVQLFEDGDMLNTVVTLGGGYRKSWRHVTADDLRAMDKERNANFKSQVEAKKRWDASLAAVLPVVLEFRTVGAAVSAGAFAG